MKAALIGLVMKISGSPWEIIGDLLPNGLSSANSAAPLQNDFGHLPSLDGLCFDQVSSGFEVHYRE